MYLADKVSNFKIGKLNCELSSDIGFGRNVKGMASEIGARNQSQLIASESPAMFLGAHSYINNGGYIREGVFIGRFCSIGRRVTIGAGMHNMYGLSTHPSIKGVGKRSYTKAELDELGINNKKRQKVTIIESDVWIGDGVIIMPGVNIHQGAVIGANSVVTKDIEPYSVVGGIPAKLLKKRFPDYVIEKLLTFDIFDYSLEYINTLSCRNIIDFINECEQELPEKIIYKTEIF